MPCAEDLKRIAKNLSKSQRYFRGWNRNVLQAFIRDGGRSVYCGTYLFHDFSVVSTGDHLLPRSKYPDLANVVQNLVPACPRV